jgi:hypothetical protein
MLVSTMIDKSKANDVTGGVCATRTLSEPVHYQQAQTLLNYVYVISLSSFVKIDETDRRRSVSQFNDMFRDIELPRNLTPANFIRGTHRQTHVVDRMEALPLSNQRIVTDEEDLRVLNLITPPPEPPPRPIKVTYELWSKHLTWLLNEDEEVVRHVERMMAWILFKPHERLHHGLLLSGKKRTGKSTLTNVMVSLLGEGSYMEINTALLKNNFNSWMETKRFVTVEEVKEAGDFHLYNKIKTYFTNPYVAIERKGKDIYLANNHVNYFLYSNSRTPINIEKEDTRIYYVHSRVTAKPKSYYEELYEYLFDNNGIWAIYYHLRDNVLPNCPSNFNRINPPVSRDHEALVSDSLNPIEEWLIERLEEGRGIFEPRKFFEQRDLMSQLSDVEYLGPALRNRMELKGILREYNFDGDNRHTLNGKKGTFAWFDRDGWGDEIKAIFTEGNLQKRREKLSSAFVGCVLSRQPYGLD